MLAIKVQIEAALSETDLQKAINKFLSEKALDASTLLKIDFQVSTIVSKENTYGNDTRTIYAALITYMERSPLTSYRGAEIPPATKADQIYYAKEDKLYGFEAALPMAHDRESVLEAVKTLWCCAMHDFKPTGWLLRAPKVTFGTFEPASLTWWDGEIEFCPRASWLHVAHEFAHFFQFARWGEAPHNKSHARLTRWGVRVLRHYNFVERSAFRLAEQSIAEFDLTLTESVT